MLACGAGVMIAANASNFSCKRRASSGEMKSADLIFVIAEGFRRARLTQHVKRCLPTAPTANDVRRARQRIQLRSVESVMPCADQSKYGLRHASST